MLTAVVLIVLTLYSVAGAQTGVSTRAIALTGSPAFGSSTEFFGSIGTPCIANNGVVAFSAAMGPFPSVTASAGLFQFQDGVGLQVARSGEPLGEHPTLQYSNLMSPILNSSGKYLFIANHNQDGRAILTGQPGKFDLLAVEGSFPDPSGQYIDGMTHIHGARLTNNGTVVFKDWEDFWRFESGRSSQIAEFPVQAQGYPDGVHLDFLGFYSVDHVGNVVGLSEIFGGSYLGQRVIATAPTSEDGIEILAGPDLPAAGTELSFLEGGLPPAINGAGITAFVASIELIGGEFLRAVWMGSGTELSPIAVEGRSAPGLPGFTFAEIDNSPAVTSSGHVLVFAQTMSSTGSKLNGIWVYRDSTLELLTRMGARVVNLPSGSVWISPIAIAGDGWEFAVNFHDQLAFHGYVYIPGIGQREAIIGTGRSGRAYAIAVRGFPVEVGPGDIRTINKVQLLGSAISQSNGAMTGDNGMATCLNDSGELVFWLEFADYSHGAFLTTIPSP